jgi:carbon storage regulator
MLILSRKQNESLVIGGSGACEPLLKVTVMDVKYGKVKLGIDAPQGVPVHRWEVWQRIDSEAPPGGAPPAPIVE